MLSLSGVKFLPERGEEEQCFQKEGRVKIAPPAHSPLPPLNPETEIISTQANETIHMLVITTDSLLFSSSPQTQLPVLCSREHLKLPVGQMVIITFQQLHWIQKLCVLSE